MTDTRDHAADRTLRWTEPSLLPDAARGRILGPGGPFELATEDVLGAPCEVFSSRPPSVIVLLRDMTKHGDRPALAAADEAFGFDSLPDAIARIGQHLTDLGVGPGERVIVCAPTSVESILVLLATTWVGGVIVPLNPAWGDAEVTSALAIARPALVVTDTASSARAAFRSWSAVGIEVAADRSHEPAPPAEVTEDDPFAIIFTSGTTGRSKGATISHRNAVHYCLSVAVTALVRGMATGVTPIQDDPSAVISSAPLFHVSGTIGQLLNGLAWGTTLVIPPPGRWDAGVHLELTERHRVTSWSIVPTQLHRLLEHPDLSTRDLTSLRQIGGGGAAFSPELLRKVEARLPHVTAGLRVGYGMTEACGPLTILQPPVAPDVFGSVGPPVAGAEIEIRDERGAPLPHGEIGMIWARSASVFLGYWDNDEATDECLDDDRWYETGDYGRIEHGVLWIESRLRDMIIRGGENIYPIEIENRLVEHPEIDHAAVIGEDDADLGQIVRAVVVRAVGSQLDADTVRAWVGEALARFKIPAIVEFRDELPMSDLGKVLKRLL